jgi:hypothetical protein
MVLPILFSGCGGGVNSPPTEYKVIVTISPSQVYEGEKVFCSAEITPAPPAGVSVVWGQDPPSPSGIFNPPNGMSVQWTAPIGIRNSQVFSLTASFTEMGKEYSGSATIVVLPKGSPPVNPPSISIEYPSDEQVVGSGTLLTILGSVQAGTNPLKELEAIDSDGTILQRWSVSSSGAFRMDLERFGVTGRKTLRLRVIDSAGLFGEASIAVLNDDVELEAQARQFLRKYNVASDGGTIPFATTDIPVVVPSSLQSYWQAVTDACNFWNKYVPLLHLYPVSSTSSEYFIKIIDDTSQTSNYVAETFRTYGVHEVVKAYIHLYKGWLSWPQDTQIGALTHELGHALVTASEIEEFGFRCVLWPILTSVNDQIIPTIMQRAVKLLYQHPPAWQP